MFASFAPSHTELTSVLGTQVGLHHPKVRGTAKASTGVRNYCVCSSWKSSEMPPSDHDSSVESVKTCPKTSESEVCRSSDLRGDPLDAMSVGGEGPPSILTRRTLATSMPTLAKPTLVKPTGQTNLTFSWERIVYDDSVSYMMTAFDFV